MENRIFFPQSALDEWIVEGTVDLQDGEHQKNNLPDLLMRWEQRADAERARPRTAQSFCVPRAEIAKSGSYELTINRYKEITYDEIDYDAPAKIVADLRQLDEEFRAGLLRLEDLLA